MIRTRLNNFLFSQPCYIFSSYEHEVLRVSYCDRAVSVMHHVSFVNFLPCECSKGHIFSPMITKLGQNVCFDEILNSKMGHVESKRRSLCQVLEKSCVYALEATFLVR